MRQAMVFVFSFHPFMSRLDNGCKLQRWLLTSDLLGFKAAFLNLFNTAAPNYKNLNIFAAQFNASETSEYTY